MGIKCGIVGLPNVGKSTLFNALTKAGIAAANYPFCTIEPNTGVVPVPDPRLEALAEIVKPQKIIPTSFEFVDIAGLVAGASQGRGPGQQVPGPYPRSGRDRARGALLRARRHRPCRRQDRPDLRHRDDRHRARPGRPGLRRKSAEQAPKSRQSPAIRKQSRANPFCTSWRAGLNQGHPARGLGLSDDEKATVRDLFLLTLKPVMYVANVLEDGFENNPHLDKVRARAAQRGRRGRAGQRRHRRRNGPAGRGRPGRIPGRNGPGRARPEPGDPRRLQAAGHADLLHRRGQGSARLAGPGGRHRAPGRRVIHTDFEKGFIRAETIAYDDFIRYQGESGASDAGRLRLEGKEYLVQEGDVLHFRFNV